MKKKKLKIFIVFFFVFWLFFLSLKKTSAQQLSLSLSPPLVEILAKPGKSILIAYNLVNYGDPTVVTAKVRPFSSINNFGQIKIEDEFFGPIDFELENSDIKLEQPVFVKTKASQQFLLRIRIKEGAPEGDYYYTFLVESKPLGGNEESTVSLSSGTIGANLLITVTQEGQVEVKGKIVIFDVLPRYKIKLLGKTIKIFESLDKIPVVLILENKGKNFLKPYGEITLKGNFGEKANFSLLPQNILAQSQRLIQASPSANIDCEEKRNEKICKHPSSFVIDGFFLGKYQLSAKVNFGEGTPTLFAHTTFYAFPFRFILITLLLMLVFIGYLKSKKD